MSSANGDRWQPLLEELDSWSQDSRSAVFWLRDDDAVAPSQQLENLLEVAEEIPLSLAVIPGNAVKKLADRVRPIANLTVLQHGWLHKNWAGSDYNEYPAGRNLDDVSAEIEKGWNTICCLFDDQATKIFVPPWHGFDPMFFKVLQDQNFKGYSQWGPRPQAYISGLLITNAHCALMEWTSPPSFSEDGVYINQIVEHLRGKRLGIYDAGEPTCLLTHHLVQNKQSYAFLGELISLVLRHPAGQWWDAKMQPPS